jgi:hypothetical protein
LLALVALPLAAQTTDSPLVAAAKATNAARAASAKKSAMVITNDNLVLTGGHMATTDSKTSVTQAAVTASHGEEDKARAEADAKAKRDAEAAKLQLLKDDPIAYYKQYAPDERKPAYGQASTVSLQTASTQTVTPQATTVQPAEATTKEIGQATTKTPQSAATTKTPEKQ